MNLHSSTSKNHSRHFHQLAMTILCSAKMRGNFQQSFPSSFFRRYTQTKQTLPAALHFIPWSWVTRMLDRAEITDHKHPAGRELAALCAGRGTAAGQLWKQLLIHFSGCSINAGQCPGFNKVLGNGKF